MDSRKHAGLKPGAIFRERQSATGSAAAALRGVRTLDFLFSIFESAAAAVLLVVVLALFPAGCRKIHHTDTQPLDTIGMSFDSLQDLKTLDVADAEVPELLKAKQAGITDSTCVELVRIAHEKKQQFQAGEAVASLRQVGMAEDAILEIARLDQLGLGVGELQAMHLAGMSDALIVEVARRHAEGKPTLSGAALAELKNAGVSEATLKELVRWGVADDQKDAIVALRRRGKNDAAVLALHRENRK